MLTSDVLRAFAAQSTRRQVATLRRVGVETEVADKVLGYLAGNFPDRFAALNVALNRAGV